MSNTTNLLKSAQRSNSDGAIRETIHDLVNPSQIMQAKVRASKIKEVQDFVLGPNHSKMSFPIKLHRIVSSDTFPELLWVDCTTFIIDKRGYERNVMGIMFKQKSIKSLEGMLHKWGFHCKKTGVCKTLVYSHPKFQYKREDLCKEITRVVGRNGALTKTKTLRSTYVTSSVGWKQQMLPTSKKSNANAAITHPAATAETTWDRSFPHADLDKLLRSISGLQSICSSAHGISRSSHHSDSDSQLENAKMSCQDSFQDFIGKIEVHDTTPLQE